MTLNKIEDIITDIRQGKMVIIMDDEDRENEGDLIMAASQIRPEDINFMARYGRGLICLPLTKEHCTQLQLPLMVNNNHAPHNTNFTVSIEAAHGVTTGISAADRATTIRAAVADEARPSDLVHPGHIFPLMAQPGGVLRRAGHTEASCDLARLAGFKPAAVLVEILNEDGSMARRPDLEIFAKQHNLKIGTIADLIRFRVQHEKTIEKVAQCALPTIFGEFQLITYQDTIDMQVHFALVKGQPDYTQSTLVRVHIVDPVCDLTPNLWKDCGWSLDAALRRVAQEGEGVVVVLRPQENPQNLIDAIHTRYRREQGEDLPAHPDSSDLRTYGLGAQILTDLGVQQMRVLSAPKKLHAISGFNLTITDYIYTEEGRLDENH